MSNNKYNVAESVIALIEKERSGSEQYAKRMRDYLLKVIEIQKANDHWLHNSYMNAERMRNSSSISDYPENGRADDYYEHGSH